MQQFMMRCTIFVPFAQFKKRENIHGGVLLLVKVAGF